MKKALCLLLSILLVTSLLVPSALAADGASNELAVVYTGNLNGDVDLYARAAAVRDYYQNQGYTAILVDVGNYMQGSAAANADRGQTVFRLMDAAGYTAAAMGDREFYYGDATTGQLWHGNFYKYYTQAELLRGTDAVTYNTNGSGTATATRAAKDPATFAVLASNLEKGTDASGYYDFDTATSVTVGDSTVGIYALSDPEVSSKIQDGFVSGYSFTAAADENAAQLEALKATSDVTICLNASGAEVSGATLTLSLPADGSMLFGVAIINCAAGTVSSAAIPDVVSKASVQAIADNAKASAEASKVGTSTVTLDGADRDNWCRETNLGDLVTDALKWYAENKFDGFKKDVPVVAIQNGGNCDQYIYSGDITKTDLLRAFPFSPMGVSIVYVTVDELAMILEAGTSPSTKYGNLVCPGFAQVSGITYEVHSYKDYLAGDAYGSYYKPTAVNRVVITSINGKSASEFKSDDKIAVIADNFLVNGGDTYYLLKEIAERAGSTRLNNGNGVKTRDIVEKYISEALGGTIDSTYAEPQGRITILTEAPTEPDQPETPFVNPYTDVSESAWYYDAVKYAYQNNVMTGMGNNRFEPGTHMTRAMLVSVLYRLEGEPEASELNNPFKDVSDNKWYTDAVCWAASKGIVMGTETDRFSPNDDVTREQMVAIMYRYASYKNAASEKRAALTGFADSAKVSAYAKESVQWAVAEGILYGSADGGKTYLLPTSSATRAQIAAIVMRFAEMVKSAQ